MICWLLLTGYLTLGQFLNLTEPPFLPPFSHHHKTGLIPPTPSDCSEPNENSHQKGTSTSSGLEYMICELGFWFSFPKQRARTFISLFSFRELASPIPSDSVWIPLILECWICSLLILGWSLCLPSPSFFYKSPPWPIFPKFGILVLGTGPYLPPYIYLLFPRVIDAFGYSKSLFLSVCSFFVLLHSQSPGPSYSSCSPNPEPGSWPWGQGRYRTLA